MREDGISLKRAFKEAEIKARTRDDTKAIDLHGVSIEDEKARKLGYGIYKLRKTNTAPFVQPGQVLTDKDIKDAGKISGVLPSDVFTNKSQVVGLSLDLAVKAGQPLVKDLVSKTPIREGLYPGEVGVWVGVTLTTSGLAKPGDLVDVYLATPSSQSGKVDAPQMVTSLQGIRVVAVVNSLAQPVKVDNSNPNGNVPSAVELAILKSQAGEFSSMAAGKVSLMLDPFANPQTASDSRNVSLGSSIPSPTSALSSSMPSNSSPNRSAASVAQPISITNAASTQIQSQTNAQQPNSVTSNPSSASNADSNFTLPVYNPTTKTHKISK